MHFFCMTVPVKVLSSLTLSGQACHVWGSWRAFRMPDEVSVRTSLGHSGSPPPRSPPDLTFDVKTSNNSGARQSVLRSTSAAHLRSICNLRKSNKKLNEPHPFGVVADPPNLQPPHGTHEVKNW